jgi:thymidylate synthase
MRAYKFKTPSEAYLALLKDVLENPEYICSPRGQKVYEVTDAIVEIEEPNSSPLVTKDEARNKVIADYTAKEKALYSSMSNRVEDFEKISKFWGKLANPDGTVNSAYGYLIKGLADHGNSEFEGAMRTPWQWCVESLKADKDTRQAIMRFSRPEHFYKGVKDFTCTTHGNWLIRENTLSLSIVMRSNDLVKGFVFDVTFFIGLMVEMLEELKVVYPDLKMGKYTHTAHSLHIYESTVDTVKKMIGQ